MLLVLLVIVLAWALVTAIAVLPGVLIAWLGFVLEERHHERLGNNLTGIGTGLAVFGWIASWVFLGGSGDEFGIGGFPFNG